jgi:glycosyltransferase involved in cell wall biosynthesis
MKITIIGCPFRTTYGRYIASLRSHLQRSTGSPVQWVASNCDCGDPIEVARQFQVPDCDYFEMHTFAYSPVGNSVKRAIRDPIRRATNHLHAARFAGLSPKADVIHLQQTLAAYGSAITFDFLRRRSNAARVITLHELDPEQTDFPELNRTYNLADALVVHDSWMKEKLTSFGVAADLVHVVCYGTDLTECKNEARDGIVFYGGHNLNKGKGLDVILQAYRHLKNRSGVKVPGLRIHGHYGMATPPDALELAKKARVADDVEWLNELSMEEIAQLYRRSEVCVLPYRGSFGGLPAGIAAANRLPIIATRFAGIPDHIGDLGIWIGGDDPVELADRITQVVTNEAMRQDYGTRLRKHAERYLGWDTVARETLNIYKTACERVAKRRS